MRLSTLIERVRRGRGRERGYALLVVIAVGGIMLTLVASALTVSTNGIRRTDTDNSWTSAYSAAVAGLSDYKARLTSASNYSRYGNPASRFSAGSAVVLPTGTLDNPAFDLGQTNADNTVNRWARVPGSSGKAWFRYEVNTTDYTKGIIHVRSTGRVGTQVRTVIADLRRKGFFDFVYFTQYEVQDYHITGQSSACQSYLWSSPARPRYKTDARGRIQYDAYGNPIAACNVVSFASGDTLNGDIFSNDQFTSCGATFKGSVTSAAPATYNGTNYPPVVTPSGCGLTNTFETAINSNTGGPNPANSNSLLIPPDASPLRQEVSPDTATGPTPGNNAGCLYTGPTRITFNEGGTMTVVSPFTRVTQPNATNTGGSSPASCGAVGVGSNQLGNPAGATFTVPADNVIYVQSVPTVTSDVNFPSSARSMNGTSIDTDATYLQATTGGQTTTTNCFAAASGVLGWKVSSTAAGSPTVRFPDTNEAYVPTPAGTDAYSCNQGDVYLSGTVRGHVTVASDRYAYITGDLLYSPNNVSGSNYNVLGLIASSAVIVWNPMTAAQVPLYDTAAPLPGRKIYAALLALGGTIMVQNYNAGPPRGDLYVKGSLAQNFRGTVATSSGGVIQTGYRKNYFYDDNLRYNAPPKYLAPANISYGVSQVANVPAVFNADGTDR